MPISVPVPLFIDGHNISGAQNAFYVSYVRHEDCSALLHPYKQAKELFAIIGTSTWTPTESGQIAPPLLLL